MSVEIKITGTENNYDRNKKDLIITKYGTNAVILTFDYNEIIIEIRELLNALKNYLPDEEKHI